ncbi:MAG: EscU/YscU/HrcU family type III secretion system export apparatus switch protein [Deltaproteobacteria bacterium]|nr:EscU/YscU/HrcU family type III secretion system export apparatus switch protein [Deltaproteobacteria bacterium]
MQLNSRRLAVALDYCEGSIPTVSAVGQNRVAKDIMAMARRYGVPTVENDELATQLSRVGLSKEIPQDLYESVANLLCEIESW